MRLTSKKVLGTLLPLTLAAAAVTSNAQTIRNGFYIGLNTGASFLTNQTESTYSVPAFGSRVLVRDETSQRGWNGGAFVGWQFYCDGVYSLAAELSFDWNSNNGHYAEDVALVNYDANYNMRYDFNLTLRPGVYINPCTQIFAQVGLAYGCYEDDFKYQQTGLDAPGINVLGVSGRNVCSDDWHLGYTLGVGIQRAVSCNFSVFTSAQYTYYDIDDDLDNTGGVIRYAIPTRDAVQRANYKVSRCNCLDQIVWKVGMTYTF